MHAHTDLTDLYRDRLTLRQISVRLMALPAEAQVWAVLRTEEQQRKERQELAELQAVHDKFRPKGGARA